MKHFVVALILSASSFASQASLLHSNGPVVDGSNVSVLTSPSTILGFGAQAPSGNSVADNFSVANGESWTITDLDFFGYQTGATAFTFADVSWSIISGDVNTGTVIASDVTTVTNGGLQGYRVTSTTLADTNRGIYLANADINDLFLGAGDYWLRWSLTGSNSFSGPFIPPVTNNNAGNAQQSVSGGLYSTLVDSGSQITVELPFAINGSVNTSDVPEPTVLAILALGLLGVAGKRRRLK